MEVNINCDLGESSKLHSTENDPLLLKIVNSANIACGYHAGDKATMEKTIDISIKNNKGMDSKKQTKQKNKISKEQEHNSTIKSIKSIKDKSSKANCKTNLPSQLPSRHHSF